jgi:hypothetical protein
MLKIGFEDSGFKRLRRNLETLAEQRTVSFAELFTPAFMRRHTRFATMEALVEASGYKVESAEDFAAIPDAEWDDSIATNSSFRNWADMRQQAGSEWMKRRMEAQ